MKTNEEIYENSMLEDDPNVTVRHQDNQPRWGPQNKGAQILANFYSRGKVVYANSATKKKKANRTNRDVKTQLFLLH